MIELLTKINERQIKMDKKYEMLYIFFNNND